MLVVMVIVAWMALSVPVSLILGEVLRAPAFLPAPVQRVAPTAITHVRFPADVA